MDKEFLPIGTIVLLKDATKKVMINGFLSKGKNDDDKIYDYIGCPFPEGIISYDVNLFFNHDQIEKILYQGYEDVEFKELNNSLNNIKKSLS